MTTPPALGTPVGTSTAARGASTSRAVRFFQVFENLGVLLMIVAVVALVSAATPGFVQPGNISSVLITAAIL
ncbi:MAG TPA: hypothetical protein VFF55_06015, partial [Candidatus Deferrimicrobium sp.]|nr:hypothetical protein [Candidatus Deferrimicrobium sp.]